MPLLRYCSLLFVCLLAFSTASLAAEPGGAATDQWLGQIELPKGNFIENGSLERGFDGWDAFKGETVTTVDTTEHHSGTASLRETGVSEQNHYLYQYNLPLETGRIYTLSAMVKTQGLSEPMRKLGVLSLINYGWTDAVSLVPEASTTDWKRLSATFKAMPTQPRPDGQPTYSLVVYWMPKTEGTVWLDDIQIEEGEQATAYTEISAKSALVTYSGLRQLAGKLIDMREVVEKYENRDLATRAAADIEPLWQATTGIRDRLRRFAQLTPTEQRALPQEVAAIAGKLARIHTMAWLGPAHIPLSDLKPPATLPETLSLDLSCVQGEHRDVALNLANLAGQGYAARLAPGALSDSSRFISTPAAQWVRLYSAPKIRGFAKPNRLFTDPLPALDEAGTVYIEPATVSQAVLGIDTSQLLPGIHEGMLRLESLHDPADRLEVNVKLRVLPVALPLLKGVDIADCYGVVDYAWPGIEEIGINTFTVNVSWTNVTFDARGNLTAFEFDRIARQVRDDLAHVPDARFHFLTMHHMVGFLQQHHSWKPQQPEFENAVKQWLQAIATRMAKLGVPPSRLRIETIDEPGPGDLKPATYLAGLVKQAVPEMQTQIYLSGVSRDADWQTMAKAHDIITPIAASCMPENMAFLKSLGRRLWIYDCQANGESLHPIAYYRLMPWMSRQYGAQGWSQFSWVNTPHDRPYKAWNGAEAQNMVYPTLDGQGAVFSRRLLAMRAGHEDYRVLKLLDAAIAAAPDSAATQVVQAREFLIQATTKALALSPRQPGYETHLIENAPQDLLDRLREQAVGHIAALLKSAATPKLSVTARADKPDLNVTTSLPGQLSVRYLLDGKLPWHTITRRVAAGSTTIELPVTGAEVSRCVVGFTADNGHIATQTVGIIPQVTVDSSAEGYGVRSLNDGIRAISSKFEPTQTWISAASDQEHWVVAELPKQRVDNITLYWMTYTDLPRQFMVQYRDGANAPWKSVSATPQWIAATSPAQRIRFAPVTATALRVLVARQGGGIGGPSMVGLSEIEVGSLFAAPLPKKAAATK